MILFLLVCPGLLLHQSGQFYPNLPPISMLFPSCGGSGESAILSPLYFLEDLRRDKASSKVIHVSGSSQEAGFTSFSPVALFICHDKGSLPGLDLPVII